MFTEWFSFFVFYRFHTLTKREKDLDYSKGAIGKENLNTYVYTAKTMYLFTYISQHSTLIKTRIKSYCMITTKCN